MRRKKILHLKKMKSGRFKSKTPLPRKLSYKHLIKENVDYDDKDSILSVKSVVDTVQGTVAAAKGAEQAVKKVYSGAVKGVNGTRRLVSRVNRIRHTPLTSRNVRQIAGRVGKSGVSLAGKAVVRSGKLAGKAALNMRDRILSASIDKTKVTDTGMETINQGITYVRYVDNARRAVVNTERATVSGIKTAVKAADRIKSFPKDTVRFVKHTERTVRNTAVRTAQTAKAIAKAGKKVAALIGKIVTSKVFPIILAAAALIIIVVLMLNFISGIIMAVGGMFSWTGDDDIDTTYKKQVEKYIETVKEIIEDEQEKIDDVYYGFECDRTEYEPYNEITEFREERFTYKKIAIDSDDEYKKVIAIAAAKWYTDTLQSDNPPDDFKLKKEQLEEVIKKSYQLDYEYEQDYCPHHGGCCKWGYIMTGGTVDDGIYASDAWYCDTYYHGCKEIREWYEKDTSTGEWLWDDEVSGIRSFCDRKHNYLKGEVENFTLSEVMEKLNFSDEEKDVYETYYAAITEWLAEE